MFSAELLQYHLQTEFLGCKINYQPEVNSTNADAWKHINEGSDEGTVFITDNQQDGRGRRQNKWISSSCKSLTYSFILHPHTELDKVGLLPLLTGVSIVKGIRSSTSIQTGLKWPNDIMLNRKKMGGILIESRSTPNSLVVVVGVGLNINETDQEIPDFLKDQATSLIIYSGKQYSREKVLSEILNEFELLYKKQWNSIIPIWEKHCIHKDSEVSFHTENGHQKGIFQGISLNGHAKVIVNGKTQTFPSGMITL